MSVHDDVLPRLSLLRHKVNSREYVTPAENTLADDLMELLDIVSSLAHETLANEQTALAAGNVASCLANGIKPD